MQVSYKNLETQKKKLVTFARGSIVDPLAIIKALDSDQLKSYVCDFPVPVFFGRSDVIAMPHIDASTA
jgi:D-3-phosphoglycerate dehydrogenase